MARAVPLEHYEKVSSIRNYVALSAVRHSDNLLSKEWRELELIELFRKADSHPIFRCLAQEARWCWLTVVLKKPDMSEWQPLYHIEPFAGFNYKLATESILLGLVNNATWLDTSDKRCHGHGFSIRYIADYVAQYREKANWLDFIITTVSSYSGESTDQLKKSLQHVYSNCTGKDNQRRIIARWLKPIDGPDTNNQLNETTIAELYRCFDELGWYVPKFHEASTASKLAKGSFPVYLVNCMNVMWQYQDNWGGIQQKVDQWANVMESTHRLTRFDPFLLQRVSGPYDERWCYRDSLRSIQKLKRR